MISSCVIPSGLWDIAQRRAAVGVIAVTPEVASRVNEGTSADAGHVRRTGRKIDLQTVGCAGDGSIRISGIIAIGGAAVTGSADYGLTLSACLLKKRIHRRDVSIQVQLAISIADAYH